MMDDHVVREFVKQLKETLGVATGASLSQLENHLDTIGTQLTVLAANSVQLPKEQKESLATEAMGALAAENARLAKLLSEREVAMGAMRIEHARVMGQMRAFLQDLSGACIGCKKLSWRPHKDGCQWSASAEKLQEVFSGPTQLNPGEDQAADDRVPGPAA